MAEVTVSQFAEVLKVPVDRLLVQLDQAGKLKGIRGVVIGDLADCDWNEGGVSPWPHTKTLEEVLEERLGSLGVPVIYKLPFGHSTHFATLPLGVQATLDSNTCTLEVTEPALH